MFCRNCGKEIPDGVRFCNHCGASQEAGTPQNDQTPPSSIPSNQNIDEKAFKKFIRPVVWRNTFIVWCIITIASFIAAGPPAISFGIVAILPAIAWARESSRVRKQIALMQENGAYEQMLREFSASSSMLEGKVRYSENYIFGKRTGSFYAYQDILWIYRFVRSFILIPYASSAMIGNSAGKLHAFCKLKASAKAGGDEITALAKLIYSKNPAVLIGHTMEKQKEFRNKTRK